MTNNYKYMHMLRRTEFNTYAISYTQRGFTTRLLKNFKLMSLKDIYSSHLKTNLCNSHSQR